MNSKIFKYIFSFILLFFLISCNNNVTNNSLEFTETYNNFLRDFDYYSAYNLCLDKNNDYLLEKCVLEWENYMIYNHNFDQRFENVSINKFSNKYFENIKNYLFEVVYPSSEDCDILLSLCDKLPTNNQNKLLINSLSLLKDHKFEDLFYIENTSLSKKDVMDINSFGRNFLMSKDRSFILHLFANDVGIGMFKKLSPIGYKNKELDEWDSYLLFGDYSNLKFGSASPSDGKWIYGLQTNDLIRINFEGEKEVIYTFSIDDSTEFATDFYFHIINHDLLIFTISINNKIYIYRIYVPDHSCSIIETNAKINDPMYSCRLLNQNSIQLHSYSEFFMNMYEKCLNDPEYAKEILSIPFSDVDGLEDDELNQWIIDLFTFDNELPRKILSEYFGVKIYNDYVVNFK